MAEVVTELPGGIRKKVDWSKYADGRVWRLSLGDLNTMPIKNARSNATVWASRHGKHVSTRERDGFFYVQFF